MIIQVKSDHEQQQVNTTKLGYNLLGCNEHSVITN